MNPTKENEIHTLKIKIDDGIYRNIKSDMITQFMCGDTNSAKDQFLKLIVMAISEGKSELSIIRKNHEVKI